MRLFTTDDKQVRTAGDHALLRFERARHTEDDLATSGILPPIEEIGKYPARSFDSEQAFHRKAGVEHFLAQILWSVKVRGSEVVQSGCWVLMMPVDKIALDPGESKDVTFVLDGRAFSYWKDPDGWTVAPGTYGIVVGTSSRDTALQGSFTVP